MRGRIPPFLQAESGHGRVEERGLILREFEATAVDFPFARTLVAIQSSRTEKKSGKTTTEMRYYLSSQQAQERPHEGWINLIREHWGGIENRNHWRRDALCGEDRTRSRNPNLVANLALLRSATLRLLNEHYPERSLPEIHESFAAKPFQILALLRSKK
jgi:predicted transposase YbfD/YdcC